MGIDNVVIGFIQDFKSGYEESLTESFSKGNCYYFAVILKERFKDYAGEIYYNNKENHFAFFLDWNLYDITGKIDQSSYQDYVPFSTYKKVEPLNAMSVEQCCIKKYDTTKEQLMEEKQKKKNRTKVVQPVTRVVQTGQTSLPF